MKRQLLGLGFGALIAGCASTTEMTDPPAEGRIESSGLSAVAAAHAAALVLDAHADIEFAGAPSRYARADGVSRVNPRLLREGGVDAVVMSVAVGPGPRDAAGYAEARAKAQKKLAEVSALVANPANKVMLATTADEVLRARAAGKTALILGFQNARSLGTNVAEIDDYHAAGVRVFALTHMGHNDFADSSRPVYVAEKKGYEVNEEHGGLSALGKQAIARINSLGAVVDISQLSKNAAMQVLDMTTAPIIASHSNVQALSNVRRNLSDEEIDRIGANGGVIHIAAFKGYLFDSNNAQLNSDIIAARREAGLPDKYDYPYELYWELPTMADQKAYTDKISELLGPGSVEEVIDHIDYVVKRIGIDHVGVGNDFNHGGGIAGFSDASGAMTLTAGLMKRGYSAEDINKIWGGNFLRVMQAAQQVAQR